MTEKEIFISIQRNRWGRIGRGSSLALTRATFDGQLLSHTEVLNFEIGEWAPREPGTYLDDDCKFPFEKIRLCLSKRQVDRFFAAPKHSPRTPWQYFKASCRKMAREKRAE